MNWNLRRDAPGASAESDIAAEMTLLDSALADPARPILRLWRTHPCLVVTPLLAQRMEFVVAAENSDRAGWPIVVRRTGGGPVPLTAGTLNISLALALPREKAPNLDATFRRFADWLTAALETCGLAPALGEIAGSCCPGRYDIAIGGRKFIGIAQRRRQGTKDGALLTAILVHAMAWLDGDLGAGVAALERFLSDAGAAQAFRRETMGTLREIAGGAAAAAALEAALLSAGSGGLAFAGDSTAAGPRPSSS